MDQQHCLRWHKQRVSLSMGGGEMSAQVQQGSNAFLGLLFFLNRRRFVMPHTNVESGGHAAASIGYYPSLTRSGRMSHTAYLLKIHTYKVSPYKHAGVSISRYTYRAHFDL